MLRTEAASGAAAPGGSGGAPGGGAGSGGLRSASPHRNAYEATIQALKPTKDAEGEDGKKARGKKYGSNVHRIKNMFLQMGTAPGPEGACDLAKGKEKPVRLSLPRASSLNESMEQGNLLKLGTSVSERVSRFDSKPDKPFSKLQETRKIFERSPQEKEATTKLLLRKERAGFQDRKLDVVVKFNGSTESLDKLDTEAVSPTVSQLSAVFEKADLRNNLHKTPGRAGPLNSKLVSKRSRVFLQGAEAGKAESRTGDGPAAPARPRPAEEEKAAGKAGRPAEKDGSVPRVQEVCKIKPVEVEESGESEAEVEAGEPVPAPELAKGAEGPAPPEPRLEGGEEPPYAEEGVKGERADEGELYDESKKEDFSEADLVDISAYSGLGEDSGGSGLDEDEEADGLYEPESSCVEIPGLSEEEEPVPNRKIQFSTAPIQVSPAAGFWGYPGGAGRRNQEFWDAPSSLKAMEVALGNLLPYCSWPSVQGWGGAGGPAWRRAEGLWCVLVPQKDPFGEQPVAGCSRMGGGPATLVGSQPRHGHTGRGWGCGVGWAPRPWDPGDGGTWQGG